MVLLEPYSLLFCADFAAFGGVVRWDGLCGGVLAAAGEAAELSGRHRQRGAPLVIAVGSQNIRLVILEGLRVSVYSING